MSKCNLIEMNDLSKKDWWNYLDEDIRELLVQSLNLLEQFKNNKDDFLDYSFLVFPAAKAYEGFLKKIFFDLKFVSREQFYSRNFRIGKSLNPFLPRELEWESVYKKIVEYAGDPELADMLWDTWKLSRNSTFHWFPEEKNAITYDEAMKRFELVISAIDASYSKLKG